MARAKKPRIAPQAAEYRHQEKTPALDSDGQNAAREQGEALLQEILEAKSLDIAKAAAVNTQSRDG